MLQGGQGKGGAIVIRAEGGDLGTDELMLILLFTAKEIVFPLEVILSTMEYL